MTVWHHTMICQWKQSISISREHPTCKGGGGEEGRNSMHIQPFLHDNVITSSKTTTILLVTATCSIIIICEQATLNTTPERNCFQLIPINCIWFQSWPWVVSVQSSLACCGICHTTTSAIQKQMISLSQLFQGKTSAVFLLKITLLWMVNCM